MPRYLSIIGMTFGLLAAASCGLYEDVSPPPTPDTASGDANPQDTSSSCDSSTATENGEPCNGRDDDCDGIVDEGCPCEYDDTSQGVCGDATRGPDGNCSAPSSWEDNESACDGRDNDCDGTVDEGCLCDYAGRGNGICQNQRVDDDGKCPRPEEFEQQESTCDDLVDNDCDGEVDERDGDCRRRPGTGCSANPQCLSGHCLEGACAHRLFVTSATTTGDVGGLNGGETLCDEAAANADLGGRWEAMLSVGGHPANEHLEIVGPVVNMNDERFADGADDLWDFEHPSRIAFDEYGSPIDDGNVWTGTTASGKVGGKRCDDWTTDDPSTEGIIGWTRKSNNAWVHAGGHPQPCSESFHLYCIDGQ